jgi:hypothetical protein
MGGVTGEVNGKVTDVLALVKTARAGVVVEYHWANVREVWRPSAAVAPTATLPEEHKCGSVAAVVKPLVKPLSNLVTQYFEPGIAGAVPAAGVKAGKSYTSYRYHEPNVPPVVGGTVPYPLFLPSLGFDWK